MVTTYEKLKKDMLRDKAVRREYDALGPEYELIAAIIKNRQRRGLSQQALAERAGTRQPVISRLERGEGNPTLDLLQRIARALDLKLSISLR